MSYYLIYLYRSNREEEIGLSLDIVVTEQDKRKKKRMLLLSFIVLALVILSVFAVILALALKDTDPLPTEEELISSFYEKNKTYFVTPDFEAKPSDDTDYMDGYDRAFYFNEGGVTVDLKPADREAYPALDTVCRLIEASMAGDHDAYNALFTERYLDAKGRQGAFTGQKLYRIIVTANGERDGSYYYTVTYAIKDNDGTLRKDIVSDAERDMVLTLTLVEGVYRIDAMSFRFVY